MEEIVYNWRRYLYAMWLGGSLSILFGATITDFRFWLVLLPTAALVHIFNTKPDWEQ
jgi:hypothetical protein